MNDEGVSIQWHRFLKSIPSSIPSLIIAHEFLDTFPVHQFRKPLNETNSNDNTWKEVLIDESDDPHSSLHFRFVLSPNSTPASRILPKYFSSVTPEKVIFDDIDNKKDKGYEGIEISPLALSAVQDISEKLLISGGAALLVDYGENFTQVSVIHINLLLIYCFM